MYRFSNSIIGFFNLFTLIASIPIMAGGIWLARSKTGCESWLQTPLLVLGFAMLLISLAGFAGACFHIAWALWVYLAVMLLLVALLVVITVFGFVVTSHGGGVEVPGRDYSGYKVDDYSPWLRNRFSDPKIWASIRSCLLGSKACKYISSWTPLDYLQRQMSPIESGCCRPPAACNHVTPSSSTATATLPEKQDPDCNRWGGAPDLLCYECDSCRGGVLEEVRRNWHKIAVLNAVMLLLLIAVYSIGCSALRNTRSAETDRPDGENRMTKIKLRWDFYWWRWWRDFKQRIY